MRMEEYDKEGEEEDRREKKEWVEKCDRKGKGEEILRDENE